MVSQMKVSAIDGIHFGIMNYLRLGNTTKMAGQIKVPVIDSIHFTQMNCLRLATTNRNS